MRSKQARKNYLVFLFSNSIASLAAGLFSPFYIIFVQGFGKSLGQFGLSIGLMALAGAITSYFAGRHSDQLGRKPFLIVGGFILSIIVLAYTLITNLFQLYLLQILNGVISSMNSTIGTTFLADLTRRSTRGRHIGRYLAVTGVITAFSLMIAGFLAVSWGYKIVFYIVATLIFLSTLILFHIKEK
ncbi:Multidrug resistance protein MdtG [uncultured archaeon]|nr:Multidrug resistance protein MdtG [uncultured archaeon]